MDIDTSANEILELVMKQIAEKENITEELKSTDSFIRKIKLNEKNHQISVEFYPDILVVPNVGAGSGNRTHVISLEG